MDTIMPPAAIPLSDLARRLARKESEVQKLRRAYETRLAELKNRREQLAEKLRHLEAEIQSVTQESPKPSADAAPTEDLCRVDQGKAWQAACSSREVAPEGGQALTVKQLADEVRRRKFPTTSKNILRLVQTRVYEMVKKGILAHASGQPGFVVKHSSNGQQTSSQEEGTGAKRSPGRKPKVAMAAGRDAGRGGQPPLREVLTRILEQQKEPIGGGELAKKALATGYKSKSKKFSDVVRVGLGKMKNIEHVPGKGYRLKRR